MLVSLDEACPTHIKRIAASQKEEARVVTAQEDPISLLSVDPPQTTSSLLHLSKNYAGFRALEIEMSSARMYSPAERLIDNGGIKI